LLKRQSFRANRQPFINWPQTAFEAAFDRLGTTSRLVFIDGSSALLRRGHPNDPGFFLTLMAHPRDVCFCSSSCRIAAASKGRNSCTNPTPRRSPVSGRSPSHRSRSCCCVYPDHSNVHTVFAGLFLLPQGGHMSLCAAGVQVRFTLGL
jgi:hypothetical protein